MFILVSISEPDVGKGRGGLLRRGLFDGRRRRLLRQRRRRSSSRVSDTNDGGSSCGLRAGEERDGEPRELAKDGQRGLRNTKGDGIARKKESMGDLSGLVNKIKDVMPADQQPELVQKLTAGTFTLRLLCEMFQNLQNMGPLGQLFSMFPGFGGGLITKGKEKEGQAKIKRYMTIMDSMTDAELDSTNPKLMNESRIIRIARGSGRLVKDVTEMLEEYKRIAKMWSKLKLNNKNVRDHQIINSLPPNLVKQMGGAAGLQTVMKQMCSKGGDLI